MIPRTTNSLFNLVASAGADVIINNNTLGGCLIPVDNTPWREFLRRASLINPSIFIALVLKAKNILAGLNHGFSLLDAVAQRRVECEKASAVNLLKRTFKPLSYILFFWGKEETAGSVVIPVTRQEVTKERQRQHARRQPPRGFVEPQPGPEGEASGDFSESRAPYANKVNMPVTFS
jgi:hypothetical protein